MKVLIVGAGRMGAFHKQTVARCGDEAITLDPLAPADHRAWDTLVGEIDAAIIACPIEHLYSSAMRAKVETDSILIEKPGAATLEQAQELAQVMPTAAVGFVERCNPVVDGFRAIRRTPGVVTYSRIGPDSGAELMLDLGSHAIDLARYLALPEDLPPRIEVKWGPEKVRTITAKHLHANLISRRLNWESYPQTDLLTLQWEAFKAGEPRATIHDALAVHQALAQPVAA